MIKDLTVTREDFDSLAAFFHDSDIRLNWNLVFTLPAWLKAWWQNFGSGAELYLRAIRQDNQIIGIAPLQIRNGIASIIGGIDVCDYQDFVMVPGKEKDFFSTLIDDLLQHRVKGLHLAAFRLDSTIATHLVPLVRELHHGLDYHQVDVSSEMDLPTSWDDYLKTLDRKQRHELRRKMRNLQDIGETSYRVIEEKPSVLETIDTFLKLFPESRQDKAQFMTAEMQTFFRNLVVGLADIGIVKFGLLESGHKPVAMVMYFDYNDDVHLYNSAYDPSFRPMSVGIISKARCIQDAIEKGKKKFDFLKGAEPYKSYLGGKEIPLYSCKINLK